MAVDDLDALGELLAEVANPHADDLWKGRLVAVEAFIESLVGYDAPPVSPQHPHDGRPPLGQPKAVIPVCHALIGRRLVLDHGEAVPKRVLHLHAADRSAYVTDNEAHVGAPRFGVCRSLQAAYRRGAVA